jgi:ribose transport system ATP-binding protein
VTRSVSLKGWSEGTPALSVRRLSKRFGNFLVLDNVELDVMPGEVHGLLGQNGSGKSTLIKILAGFHNPEPGAKLAMYGRNAALPMPPGAARQFGIAFVHQHLGLVPSLSVLENLRLGIIASETRWKINWRREADEARTTFERFGLSVDPLARIGDLPQVTRALVAIVRAFEDLRTFAQDGLGVLILDEPTPFLPKAGVDKLFSLVRSIAAQGVGVVFVSHDIDEILEITDRATVLRDGKLAGTVISKATERDTFIELIVGRRVQLYQSEKPSFESKPVVAVAANVSGPAVNNVSLTMHEGEITGLTGLIGSGFDVLLSYLYGSRRPDTGHLQIGGRTLELTSLFPEDAMAYRVAYLPADRIGAAGVGSLSVAENVSLPVLKSFRKWFGIDWRSVVRRSRELGRQYIIRPNDPNLLLSMLSGGNAQKALMAKWLQSAPRLLLLDEPTQGVDVGARQHLFSALAEAAAAGASIVVSSTDAEQLAQICHRILVFAQGKIATELTGSAISKERITEECLRSSTLMATSARAKAA